MTPLARTIAPLVAYARESIARGDQAQARRALDATRVYLALLSKPEYMTYTPSQIIRDAASQLENEYRILNVEPMDDCPGAPERMLACLRQFVCAAELEADSVLTIEAFQDEDTPCVALSLDGPGRFPARVRVDGFLALPMTVLRDCWTRATRGGRVDDAPNGLLLRLAGLRLSPEPNAQAPALLTLVSEALAALDQTGNADAVSRCLERIEGEAHPRETVGMRAVLAETTDALKADLAESGILVEIMADPDTPPLLLERAGIETFIATAAAYAAERLVKGGSFTVLTAYRAGPRTVEITVGIQGPQTAPVETFHLAGLRRAMIECLGGTFGTEAVRDRITLMASVPDAVGAVLDAWLPGWDSLADQSQQMLRLLKSGGPCPPEDFLLGGIAESELARWLLPRLASPAAVNVAHEIAPKVSSIPGISRQQLDKALGQIMRGKPRKEIAAPPYAAQILRAFNRDDRGRAALSLQGLQAADIAEFAGALDRTPADHVACLACLIKVLRAQTSGHPQNS
ncbi:MAG TPA: hypothetical protein PLO37_13845 [Candidatus Hydrogenedentes bacterium]|mgnify:CR=1 FL=1|nr:hypothetical protein [Candidatus Hydrogenedentota bacterium]HPG67927.1 hypothetical protein [Candidatus Hydrogenedentota bacterium]